MDSATFHAEVYRIVNLIPYGKTTSYGENSFTIGNFPILANPCR